MAAPLLKVDDAPQVQPQLLSLLRMAAMGCRSLARLDAGRACALLDPEAGPEQVALFLARALPQVMQRRPVILPPGAQSRSFDEDWLLALQSAVERRDRMSERFLLKSRCTPHGAHSLSLLMHGLVDRLSQR